MSAGRRGAAPAGPALGIYARSSDGRPRLDRKKSGRASQFRLQRIAAALLYDSSLELGQKQHRTCTCHRRRKAETVEVLRDTHTGHSHFRGTETCGSVWACPVCSPIITERRRREIQDAITRWKLQGGDAYLMTLTFPHTRRDVLEQLLELLRQSLKVFHTSRPWVATKKQCGRIGSIRALEVTYGPQNGWHPHVHVLVFAAPGQLDALRELLQDSWIAALLKVGAAERNQVNDMLTGRDGEAVAFDIRGGDYAADYVAKFGHEPAFTSMVAAGETWGAASEVAKGATKITRVAKRFTPFTLLVVYDRGGVPYMTKAQAGEAFREFAAAFKGERQLYWSPKLRATLGMGAEESDEEAIERTLEELQPKVVSDGQLNAAEWKLVIAHDARSELLWASEQYGAAGVRAMLAELRARPPTHRASLTES